MVLFELHRDFDVNTAKQVGKPVTLQPCIREFTPRRLVQL